MSNIKNIVRILPQLPGVYQFFNKNGVIIYIGKAINLRSRVSSYFNSKNSSSFKTQKLAKQVCDIKHIVVETEADALLLENNLIKQYQPKYNILLKDDKTFPWICIKKENFPRVFSTRKKVNDGSEYFGPYTSALMVRTLINLVRQMFQIRTCSYNLDLDSISRHKFKVCLDYHLGNCLGPCAGYQKFDHYLLSIEQVRKILKGDIQQVLDYLKDYMLELSSQYKYEEAEIIKNKYEILNKFKSKSTIVNPKIHNVEVYSIIPYKEKHYVNFLKIIEGSIVQSHSVELISQVEETIEDILGYAILDIRQKVHSNTNTIYTPFPVTALNNLNLVQPKIGDKKKLLELSERNALQYALTIEKRKGEIALKLNKVPDKLLVMQKDLRLNEVPYQIECFDNSNIQGTSPVAACVVFKNGVPAKKDYRHYHIKTVVGANDFASMEEIIYRRYKRLLDEDLPLPQLIVIDGGKGQLGAAVKSLKKLNIYGKIAVLGIAKKLEELFFPGDPIPLYLNKNSSSLKIIQHLRNEAHRFGITFHRNVRSKKMVHNQLMDIEGVGEKTYEKLFKEFGSIENIATKSIDELKTIVSKNTANNIFNFFNLKDK